MAGEKETTGLIAAIRVRPLKATEGACVWTTAAATGSISQTTADGEAVAEKKGSTSFCFDYVYEAATATQDIYDGVARDIVDGVLEGVNGTVFAYGQTSSGKTFTMQGAGGEPGVMHLAAEQIFARIAERPDHDFLLRCSYIEVYNEVLRDLLAVQPAKAVQLREGQNRVVYVDGAVEEIVTDAAGILAILAKGEQQRSVGSTAMNERSSRSHTVFRVVVECKARAGGEADGVLVGALSLVDLAGSESVRHTGATGQRAKEGGKINQSLLTLSRVIKQLSDDQHNEEPTFVNFRDSKLTRLLQPTLGGDARLAMICCVAPSVMYVEETRSTLQFAQRAARVRLKPRVHEILDDASQLRRVKRQLAELQRKQQEYEAVGRSGKTEELSRLLDANTQLSAAVADKEAELSNQIEMIDRLKKMFVLGGGGADAVSRLGENGFITTRGHRGRRKARETWAPGVAPHVLFSATAKLPSHFEAPPEDADLIVFEEDDDGGGDSAAVSPMVDKKKKPPRRSSSSSPLASQLTEHRRRSASQVAELRTQLDDAIARADQAERALLDAGVELRAECAAADDDADKRRMPRLAKPDDDASILALCSALRDRRERWRTAMDAATDDRAGAEREAYVLKQEVVELREVSESFDAHVAEIDAELEAARVDASEVRRDLEAALADLAAKDAQIARAVDAADAAEASREAALDRLAQSTLDTVDKTDEALRKRAQAVETAEALRSDLGLAAAREADLRRAQAQAEADLADARRDLEAKDARIKRLESVKMTTDIFRKIQNMQVEKARVEGENKELKAQLAQLEAEVVDAKDANTDSSSPYREAAAALTRGGAASVAARLQIDELASRNSDLDAKLKTLAAQAKDLVAACATTLGHAVPTDADGLLDDADLARLVADLDRRPPAPADLETKVSFLEQENLDLLLEIKQLRESSSSHTTALALDDATNKTPFHVDDDDDYDKAPLATSAVRDKENLLLTAEGATETTIDGARPECTQS